MLFCSNSVQKFHFSKIQLFSFLPSHLVVFSFFFFFLFFFSFPIFCPNLSLFISPIPFGILRVVKFIKKSISILKPTTKILIFQYPPRKIRPSHIRSMALKPTLFRLLICLRCSCIHLLHTACFAHALHCAYLFAHLLKHSQVRGNEVSVHDMNASISYGFNP